MNKNRALFAMAVLVSMILSAPAATLAKHDCELGDITIVLPFPVRQLSPSSPAVDFTVKRRNPSVECEFWIGFSKGQASSYDRKLFGGAEQIDYDVFKSPSSPPLNLKTYPEAASLGEVYTGRFDKGGGNPNQKTYVSRPILTAPLPGPFNIKPPGLYSDTVTIRVFEGTFPPSGAPFEIASANQSYTYSVPPFAYISLLDSGAPYTEPPITLKTLNFGTLTNGEVMSFDLLLLFNSGYRVTFASQQGSRLKHNGASSFVPYAMTVNGAPVVLNAGQPQQVLSGSGISASAPGGFRVPVSVTIGTISSSLAGSYSDSVTIVMTSL